MTIAKAHHYAIDAASLLETCLTRLRETIVLDKRKRHVSLVNMEAALVTTEGLLLAYVCQKIDVEREAASNVVHLEESDSEHEVPSTLLECIEMFQSVLEAKKQRQQLESRHVRRDGAPNVTPSGEKTRERKKAATSTQNNTKDSARVAFDHSRSPVDSLLFRLIVALQLCLVRIDDAHFVITGRRYRQVEEGASLESSLGTLTKVGVASTVCVVGFGSFWIMSSKSCKPAIETRGILKLSGKMALAAFAGKVIVREWGCLWMTAKIMKSTADVEEWQQQWILVQNTRSRRGSFASPDAKSQRLIEYAMSQSPKVSQ